MYQVGQIWRIGNNPLNCFMENGDAITIYSCNLLIKDKFEMYGWQQVIALSLNSGQVYRIYLSEFSTKCLRL